MSKPRFVYWFRLLSLSSFIRSCVFMFTLFNIVFVLCLFCCVFVVSYIYIIIKKGRGVCVRGMGWDDGFSFLVGTLISMLCLCYFNI